MTEPCKGWGIRVKWRDAPGYGLIPSIHWTRREAIAEYNVGWKRPGQYAKDRKAGRVLAVRVTLSEDDAP